MRLVVTLGVLVGLVSLLHASPDLTPVPAGPFHIEGNEILDVNGQRFLIRGTQLPKFDPQAPDSSGMDFGPFSATAFSVIRKRYNLNAVRLPVSLLDCAADPGYSSKLARVVQRANRMELLAILVAQQPSADRDWNRCATRFKDWPNVVFEVSAMPETAVDEIRRAGARQPIVVPSNGSRLDDPNLIYEISPRSAGDRDRLVGLLGTRTPILASHLEMENCSKLPPDPTAAADMVRGELAYLDHHRISWVVSSFEPGGLIRDYRLLEPTTLENGWACGTAEAASTGIGVAVSAHLRDTPIRGLFPVHNTTGSFVLARGGLATAYGPILAERDAGNGIPPLPTRLSNVSVRVVDSAGVARLAPLLHVVAGWASINFIVPPECALGPVRVMILRADSTSASGDAIVSDIAPGLLTGLTSDHGPAVGYATLKSADGRTRSFATCDCEGETCRTSPIPLSPGVRASVRLLGTGFRFAGPSPDIQTNIGEIPLPVLSFGPGSAPGVDEITLQLAPELRDSGEQELVLSVNGRLSNVVRIRFGSRTGGPARRPGMGHRTPINRATVIRQHGRAEKGSTAWSWDLPEGFPRPRVPADNPMGPAKVKLGRYLFYDRRMSLNETQSCASCHRQELAFTDGMPLAIGALGGKHARSAMSLANAAYSAALNWSNPTRFALEDQALTPPSEMGLNLDSVAFRRAVRSDPIYRDLFPRVFPNQADPFALRNVLKAIACFERTIVSARSPFDRYHYGGDQRAISDSAKRGEVLFWHPAIGCFRCHGGFNFTDATDYDGNPSPAVPFHNTGLYNIAGPFSYPEPNLGIYTYTRRPADAGKFKAPSLRNVALTAPYMHDGSIPTLEGVLDHYAAGGRSLPDGPYAGIGRDNPNKESLIRGFHLTAQNRQDLLAFLRSLTDEELIRDPRFSDPW